MKLTATAVLATTASAQYLPYGAALPGTIARAPIVARAPIAARAPIYAPYAAAPVYHSPIVHSAPVIRRPAPVTVAAPMAPMAPTEEEEEEAVVMEIEEGPSIQDSFNDWNVVRKDYMFADAYADSYNLFSTYNYANSNTSPSTIADRQDFGTLQYARSNLIAYDNYGDQLQQAYLSGADAETIYDLEQSQYAASLWATQGLRNFKYGDDDLADKLGAAGFGVALNQVAKGMDGSYASEVDYNSALSWYMGNALSVLGNPTQGTEILAFATMYDAEAAELALWDAEDAYYANPTRANAAALDIAEMNYDSAMAGYYGGLASLSPALDSQFGGNFGNLMFMQQYAIAEQIAELALEDATADFVSTHGVSPYSYLSGYY